MELTISIGIVAGLAAVTIVAVGPRRILLTARDAQRGQVVEEVQKAITQWTIDTGGAALSSLELLQGAVSPGTAVHVCKPGMDRDSSCVNLDFLRGTYLPELPDDTTETCDSYSGYKIYRDDAGRYNLIAVHQGKLPGDTVVAQCVLDTVAPLITNTTPSDRTTVADTFTVEWTTDEPGSSQVEYWQDGDPGNIHRSSLLNAGLDDNGDGDMDPAEEPSTSHSVVLEALRSYTLYRYRLVSLDPVGNRGVSAESTFMTDDTEPPILSSFGVVQANKTDSQIILEWSTNELASTSVRYWEQGDDEESASVTLEADTSPRVALHTVVLTGLKADTVYQFRVLSRDGKLNQMVYPQEDQPALSFHTLPDQTPPILQSLRHDPVQGSGVTLRWETNEPSTAMIHYGKTPGYELGSFAVAPQNATGSVFIRAFTNLDIDTQYHFRVVVTDTSPQTNEATPQAISVTITDTTEPAFQNNGVNGASAPAVSVNTGTSALIVWNTSELSDTQVEYRKATDATWIPTTLNSTPKTAHQVWLYNLVPETGYVYRVRSRDTSGNLLQSPDAPFTTASNDPIITVSPVSNPLFHTATVTWSANRAINKKFEWGTTDAYGNVSTSAVFTSPQSHTLTSLLPSTTYFYRITAVDAAANEAVVTGSFTTIAGPTVGLVAHYALDETSGTSAASAVAGGSPATLANGAVWNTDVSPAPWSARSVLLDGTNDYIITPNLRQSFTDSSVTVALWFKPTAGGVILTELNSTSINAGWHATQAEVMADGTVRVRVWQLNTVALGKANFNQWNHVVMRYNAATSRVEGFLNGVKAAGFTSGSRSTPFAGGGSIHYAIGAVDSSNMGDGTYFNGLVDDIRIYNQAISDADAISLATGVTADTTAPTISSFTPTPSERSATLQLNLSEHANATIAYGTVGGTYGTASEVTQAATSLLTGHTFTIGNLTAGANYRVRVTGTDAAGNAYGPQTVDFTTSADTTNPTLTSGPTLLELDADSLRISWTTSELTTTAVKYMQGSVYDAGSAQTQTVSGTRTSHSVDLNGLTPGAAYSYKFAVTDLAGRSVEFGPYTYTKDGTPPSVVTHPFTNAGDITPTQITIRWTTNEAVVGRIRYSTGTTFDLATSRVTAASTTYDTSPVRTITGLAEGTTYAIRITSTDRAANATDRTTNASGVQYVFTSSDTTTPVISAQTKSAGETTATITWTTSEPVPSRVEYGTNTSYSLSMEATTERTSHSLTLTGLTPNTQYYFRIKAYDGFNTAYSTPDTFTTSDTTAPTISNVRALDADGTETTQWIRWETNETATSHVLYKKASDSTWTPTTTAVNTTHAFQLLNLIRNTQYQYRVQSRDAAGNTSIHPPVDQSPLTFFTDDTTPPTITYGPQVSGITDTRATIGWTTSEEATQELVYRKQGSTSWIARGDSLNINASQPFQHSVTLTGLEAGATYQYYVTSRDAAGNSVAVPSTIPTFTTVTDATPPVISNVQTTVTGETTATITWTTNEVATGSLAYGENSAYNLVIERGEGGASGDVSTTYTVLITGLKVNTQYQFRILATDGTGLTSNAYLNSFTTQDTSAPQVSAVSAQVQPGEASVIIGWTTNEPATGQVRYDTSESFTNLWYSTFNGVRKTSHEHTISEHLVPNTRYHYKVTSTDASGKSTTSPVYQFITDAVPPVMTVPVVSGRNAAGATVTWNTTNETATGALLYRVQGSQTWLAGQENDSLLPSQSLTLTGLQENQVYEYVARATDWAGNVTQQTGIFSTDVTAPGVSGAVQTPATTGNGTFQWATNESAQYRVHVGTEPNALVPSGWSAYATSFTYTPAPLTSGQTYHYKVELRDAALNTWLQEPAASFTMP